MLAGGNKRKRKQGIVSVDELLKKQEQVDHERIQADDDDRDSSADGSGSERNSDCGTDEDKMHTFSSITPVGRVSLARRPMEGNTDKKLISVHIQAPLSFSELGISDPLQAALASMSISKPTEVQTACIPVLLDGESTISVYRGASDSHSQRQRLHRECKNWFRKDNSFCSSYLAEIGHRPIWHICARPNSYKVHIMAFTPYTSSELYLQGVGIPNSRAICRSRRFS